MLFADFENKVIVDLRLSKNLNAESCCEQYVDKYRTEVVYNWNAAEFFYPIRVVFGLFLVKNVD